MIILQKHPTVLNPSHIVKLRRNYKLVTFISQSINGPTRNFNPINNDLCTNRNKSLHFVVLFNISTFMAHSTCKFNNKI